MLRLLPCALIAAVLVVTGTGVQATPTPAPAAPDLVEVPVEGSFTFRTPVDPTGPTVHGAVHAVRRVPGGTAVYYSLGVREGQVWEPTLALRPQLGRDRYKPFDAASVAVVDVDGLGYYQPMVGPSGCLCPGISDLGGAAGVLHVGWAVLPPLPPQVRTVSVRVADGAVVEQVPVGEGALTPSVAEPSTVLGQAWPALPDASAVPDPQVFVRALVRNVSDRERTVTSQERPGQVDESLAADVLFAVDSATLTPAARSTLAALAGRLRERATGTVTVVGHTDGTGATAYNEDLSLRRAQAVVDALQPELGGQPVLRAEGRGEREPVADEATDDGRARNRRVTVGYDVAAER